MSIPIVWRTAALAATFAAAAFAAPALLSPENLKLAKADGLTFRSAGPGAIVIDFPASDSPTSLTIPVPAALADWSKAGAVTFRFRSNSTIRWDLVFRNAAGETFPYRVQPYAGVAVKAAISGNFLRGDFMNNRQFRAHWMSNWGNHIDLSRVESIRIAMTPNRPVRLELGPIAIEPHAAEDEILDKGPFVDEFGQWIGAAWPGKIRDAAQLAAAWKSEDASIARAPESTRYGGWPGLRMRATGFFRTEQKDGRWWLVDPEGYAFFSAGPDCMRVSDGTRVRGRESVFAQPPDAEIAEFYKANLRRRYGDEYLPAWSAHQARRLKAWGFNTVANWSDDVMFSVQVPYVARIEAGRYERNWQAFPDVYSQEWVRWMEDAARQQAAPRAQDPYLIGWFIGNEPRWPGRNLVGRILDDPQPSATQTFVRGYLKQHGDTAATREKLLEVLSRHYFSESVKAIRKADPNHLVLGIRWAGSAPEPVLRANDAFDVFSINIYRFEPPRDLIDKVHALTGKPVVIGEFHFGAAERGYAPALVMVKDEAERATAYRYYMERAAAHPAIVGAHWFQWIDQPVSGRFDGENYQIGFVSQQDLPYPGLIQAAAEAHRRMYEIHAGKTPPTEVKAKVR